MRRRPYRWIALLCLVVYLPACARWKPTTIAPRTLVEEDHPSKVRVVRTDGTTVEVRGPVIRSDSIVTSEPCDRVVTPDGTIQCAVQPPAVALSEAESVEVPDPTAAATATVLVAVVGIGLVYAVVRIACAAGGGCGYQGGS